MVVDGIAANAGANQPSPPPFSRRPEPPATARLAPAHRRAATTPQSKGRRSPMISNAMDRIGMDCNGVYSIPIQCIPLDWIALRSPVRVNDKRQLGAFTTIGVNDPIAILSKGGEAMASCFICQTELAPPVRAPHRLRQKVVSAGRSDLLPTPHHSGRGGGRRHLRG